MSEYDHRDEVSVLRTAAETHRTRAREIRQEAAEVERRAQVADARAAELDAQADHVHRLCTAGSDPPAACCARPDGGKHGCVGCLDAARLRCVPFGFSLGFDPRTHVAGCPNLPL